MAKKFLLGAIGGVIGALVVVNTRGFYRNAVDQTFLVCFVGGIGAFIGFKLDQQDEDAEVSD
tara:strand:+ start:113 stop:298 length:186 start_codon:yes stop_codon:yes gene_type:complete